eukprot:CAMPEP_0203978006 /NCGR_PEP_ID=MMETSP0359-20131031/101900_1 /ASSEMBLY_ACC=CAM_ASM_000338 /TAXON_ID=268821 /ORGANISM="Scrippsiella Hangoei, Strain SHTV-5" /LENGTH=559 /DNA_ID=CAMNT_0050916215 /DNA_START=819 /DNA_END=2496 /DNA_ORIENTATION=+
MTWLQRRGVFSDSALASLRAGLSINEHVWVVIAVAIAGKRNQVLEECALSSFPIRLWSPSRPACPCHEHVCVVVAVAIAGNPHKVLEECALEFLLLAWAAQHFNVFSVTGKTWPGFSARALEGVYEDVAVAVADAKAVEPPCLHCRQATVLGTEWPGIKAEASASFPIRIWSPSGPACQRHEHVCVVVAVAIAGCLHEVLDKLALEFLFLGWAVQHFNVFSVTGKTRAGFSGGALEGASEDVAVAVADAKMVEPPRLQSKEAMILGTTWPGIKEEACASFPIRLWSPSGLACQRHEHVCVIVAVAIAGNPNDVLEECALEFLLLAWAAQHFNVFSVTGKTWPGFSARALEGVYEDVAVAVADAKAVEPPCLHCRQATVLGTEWPGIKAEASASFPIRIWSPSGPACQRHEHVCVVVAVAIAGCLHEVLDKLALEFLFLGWAVQHFNVFSVTGKTRAGFSGGALEGASEDVAVAVADAKMVEPPRLQSKEAMILGTTWPGIKEEACASFPIRLWSPSGLACQRHEHVCVIVAVAIAGNPNDVLEECALEFLLLAWAAQHF